MGQIQKMTFWCATVGGVALPESGGQLIPQLFRIYQPPKKRMSTGLGQIRYTNHDGGSAMRYCGKVGPIFKRG